MPQLIASRGYGTSECPPTSAVTTNGERLVTSFGYGTFIVVPAPVGPRSWGEGASGSYGLYNPPVPVVTDVDWIQVLGEDPSLEHVEVQPVRGIAFTKPRIIAIPAKDPGEIEPPPITPPPIIRDQDEWLQLSDIPTKAPGPGVSPPFDPPVFQDQIAVLEGHQVPMKAPGLERPPDLPAPAPVVRDQLNPAQLDQIPTKAPGPPVLDLTRPRPKLRRNVDWMREYPPDTTPIRSTARPFAPPTVLPPTGAREDDTFQSRRIAPPPAPDPSRRSLPTPAGERRANLDQFVYGWAQTVLRWETGQSRFGAQNPVPVPQPLVIPPEYAWHIATRDRIPIADARQQIRHATRRELHRLIVQTDAAPAGWREAFHATSETVWQRLRQLFRR